MRQDAARWTYRVAVVTLVAGTLVIGPIRLDPAKVAARAQQVAELGVLAGAR
ncbi:hypothetical protein [Nocardioides sp. GY 10127]|uniref:hypothetical protein n=1 Tax=Nocardioides sp. GY 10127 TaxID=2569762 RepID=UPI0014583FDC|nr:hypothetical protein [Nocardioides sp. GY 10127]